LHDQLYRSHKVFKTLGPIRTAVLIRDLAERARSPREIADMASPVAMMSLTHGTELSDLVARFDQLLRLWGKPAHEAMAVADTLTKGSQLAASSFNEFLDAMIAVGLPTPTSEVPQDSSEGPVRSA
jgi:hypothetical protein